MWSDLVAEPGRMTHVAEPSAGLVGFTSSIRLTSPPRQLELTSLYVLPSYFGTGIGAVLYEKFDRELTTGQIGLLEVGAGNHRAIAFYRRRGWTPTSLTRPGPQGLDFISYELKR